MIPQTITSLKARFLDKHFTLSTILELIDKKCMTNRGLVDIIRCGNYGSYSMYSGYFH